MTTQRINATCPECGVEPREIFGTDVGGMVIWWLATACSDCLSPDDGFTKEDANAMIAMADAVGTEVTDSDAARLRRWASIVENPNA